MALHADERLDRAVYAAYGWTFPMAADEALAALAALNAAKAKCHAGIGLPLSA